MLLYAWIYFRMTVFTSALKIEETFLCFSNGKNVTFKYVVGNLKRLLHICFFFYFIMHEFVTLINQYKNPYPPPPSFVTKNFRIIKKM